MPHGSAIEIVPARSTDVFRLVHDYSRRLEWDTLLQAARMSDHWTEPQLNATTVCTGQWYLGSISLKTEYVPFNPPDVAAVKLLNRPLFFQTCAATIRHQDRSNGTLKVEYKYNFTARPAWLRWLLHPIMSVVFRWETKRRLRALRLFFKKNPNLNLPLSSNLA